MIRLATVSDSKDILDIYAPFIEETTISFETEVPAIDEFSHRIETILKQYPFLVYEFENKIVGYAYASRHKERAAYAYNADVSVYFLPEYHGSGKAYSLYHCLFLLLDKLGYKNAYAGCAEPNIKTRKFHEKFGFKLIGTCHKTGFKFGKWHDVSWFEKTISEHDGNPGRVMPMSEISHEYLRELFHLCNAV